MIPVNEVFDTLQGEATHTGTPATFLRLQGCAVGCPWCDTKHTWTVDDKRAVSSADMEAKTESSDSFANMTIPEIVAMVGPRAPRAVVITGGEPCIQDLTELTAALFAKKRLVQVETSGTQPIRVTPSTWVTLSPKVNMPGGFTVRADAAHRADEIKWPVGAPRDLDALFAFLIAYKVKNTLPIWLQPLSRSQKATALCVAAATEHGFRVSIQVHALIGVR